MEGNPVQENQPDKEIAMKKDAQVRNKCSKQDHWISENKCALLPQLIVAGVCGKHGAHAQKLAEAFEHPKERSSKKHRMAAQNVWER